MKRKLKQKQVHGYEFSYSKNMANFEAFHWNIPSSLNLLFLRRNIPTQNLCTHHQACSVLVVCSSAKIMLLIRSVIIASIISGVWSADGIHILSKTREPGCNPVAEDITLQLRVCMYIKYIIQVYLYISNKSIQLILFSAKLTSCNITS